MPKLPVVERLNQHDQHLSKHHREIAAIRKLIIAGMRMVNEMHRENREFQKNVQRLERKIDAFIDSRLHPRNGHDKRSSEIR